MDLNKVKNFNWISQFIQMILNHFIKKTQSKHFNPKDQEGGLSNKVLY